jgi:hypothetical protein
MGPPAKTTSNPTLNVWSPASLPITYSYPFCKYFCNLHTWLIFFWGGVWGGNSYLPWPDQFTYKNWHSCPPLDGTLHDGIGSINFLLVLEAAHLRKWHHMHNIFTFQFVRYFLFINKKLSMVKPSNLTIWDLGILLMGICKYLYRAAKLKRM